MEESRTVVVYKFTLGDVEDPEIYAAGPIWEWQQSESGKWVMDNAVETPTFSRIFDSSNYAGYSYIISARLQGAKLTEWLLRYGNSKE